MNPAVRKLLHDAAADALDDILENDLAEAREVTPIEETTLIRSGFTELDRAALTGQVAFDTPYAVVQHEDPTLKHDDGRTDHYLSDTVEANRARNVAYLQSKIAGAI
jgi:hypothetical protein